MILLLILSYMKICVLCAGLSSDTTGETIQIVIAVAKVRKDSV